VADTESVQEVQVAVLASFLSQLLGALGVDGRCPRVQTLPQFAVTLFNKSNIKNSEIVSVDTRDWVPF
jgi:hypothetical protein